MKGHVPLDGSSASAILNVLGIVVEQLNNIAQDVEVSVVGVCSGFQGMSTRARSALSQAADILDRSGDGGLPACVHRIRMSLNTINFRLQSMQVFTNNFSDCVKDMDDRLDSVFRLGEKMIEVSNETRLAVNRSISEIRRGRERNTSLESCLEPVQAMTQTSLQCGQLVCSLIGTLRSSIKDCSKQARELIENETHTFESRDRTIRDSLDQLNTAYERMSGSLSSSAAMNRQLNNDIGQAVMSMQFQDRVNQRIQHIVDTINELARDLRPLSNNSTPETIELLTKLWIDRLTEKSTMVAERSLGDATASPSDHESTIELF